MKSRISADLKKAINSYILEKYSELEKRDNTFSCNEQKIRTLEKIKACIQENTLTAAVLIDILAELTQEQTKNLFAVGLFSDEASTKSNAARLIAMLFEELGSMVNM